jgi:hypothetical protein
MDWLDGLFSVYLVVGICVCARINSIDEREMSEIKRREKRNQYKIKGEKFWQKESQTSRSFFYFHYIDRSLNKVCEDFSLSFFFTFESFCVWVLRHVILCHNMLCLNWMNIFFLGLKKKNLHEYFLLIYLFASSFFFFSLIKFVPFSFFGFDLLTVQSCYTFFEGVRLVHSCLANFLFFQIL